MTDQEGTPREVLVVGTSFRTLGFGRLGELVISPEAPQDLCGLQQALGVGELLYVSTCNRVECYALGKPQDADQLRQDLVGFFAGRGVAVEARDFFCRTGERAVEHLFQVASSLDSLLLGETEIAGQLRRALTRARDAGMAGGGLEGLLERALRCARRVRRETAIGDTASSVASVAVRNVRELFGPQGPGTSVLVGVGEMCRKAAGALQPGSGRRLVVNRTRRHAEEFCQRYGGQPVSLEDFRASPPAWIDLLFCATAADESVITAAQLEPALRARRRQGTSRPLVVIDLGMPRDVDSAVDALPGVSLITLETVEATSRANRQILAEAAVRGREIVAEELARWSHEVRAVDLASRALDGFFSRRLLHIKGEDRAALRSFFTGLAGRIARQPHSMSV